MRRGVKGQMLHVQLLYIHMAIDFQMLPVYNKMMVGTKKNPDKVK